MRPWDNKILRYPIVKLFLISVYTYWLLYKSSWYVCCEIYRHGQYADYQINSAHAAYSLNSFILGKLDRMLWVYWLSHETVQSIEFIEQALPYIVLFRCLFTLHVFLTIRIITTWYRLQQRCGTSKIYPKAKIFKTSFYRNSFSNQSKLLSYSATIQRYSVVARRYGLYGYIIW